MSKVKLIVGGLFLPVGLVFLGLSWHQSDADSTLRSNGVRTEGTVIELARVRGRKGKRRFRSIIEFRDQAGNRQQVAGAAATRSPSHTIGQRVGVIYDPANPADAMEDSFVGRRLASLILGFLGSLFALLGAAVIFRGVRQRSPVPNSRSGRRRSRGR